jgi:hypothetical protein
MTDVDELVNLTLVKTVYVDFAIGATQRVGGHSSEQEAVRAISHV